MLTSKDSSFPVGLDLNAGDDDKENIFTQPARREPLGDLHNDAAHFTPPESDSGIGVQE